MFHPSILGLVGSNEATRAPAGGFVTRAVEGFQARAKRIPAENGDCTMNQTDSVFLLQADNQFLSIIDFHEDRAFAVPKPQRLFG